MHDKSNATSKSKNWKNKNTHPNGINDVKTAPANIVTIKGNAETKIYVVQNGSLFPLSIPQPRLNEI